MNDQRTGQALSVKPPHWRSVNWNNSLPLCIRKGGVGGQGPHHRKFGLRFCVHGRTRHRVRSTRQLHTHFVMFNATWDKTEQRWKALQTSGMFMTPFTMARHVYRNELVSPPASDRLSDVARRRAHLRLRVCWTPNSPSDFSKRSKERDVATQRRKSGWVASSLRMVSRKPRPPDSGPKK